MACRAGIISFFLTTGLFAFPETIPWTLNDKLLYVVPSVSYSHFGFLPVPTSHYVWLEGLSLYISPDSDIETSFHADVGETRPHSFFYNSFGMTISKIYMNDVIGDPYSLMVSLNAKNVGGRALADPALLHFGEWEWKATAAIGKEWTCNYEWQSRLSGFVSLGLANRGSPWMEEGITFEQNVEYCHRYAIQLRGLECFGKRNIGNTPFHTGWASYSFAFLALSGIYTEIYEWGDLSFVLETTLWTTGTFSNITSASIIFTIPFSP